MTINRQSFIDFALEHEALCFGAFTLKSGRHSPYFFNSGRFDHGGALARLARFYADAILNAGIEFDMLFGPAYKGIPLAAATAVTMSEHHGRNVPYCFDRKETKLHGEGGVTFGAPLAGRVLIIDDVLSAGTAVNRAVELIRAAGATPVALAIALDRQEKGGDGELSAAQEMRRRHDLRVISIVTLTDLIDYLRRSSADDSSLAAIFDYQKKYGAGT